MQSSVRRTARTAAAPPTPELSSPWSIVAVEPKGESLATVHRWMNEPHVAERWGQDWPLDEWAAEIVAQLAADHCRPWLVRLDGVPVAYVEIYRVAADIIADVCPVDDGDLGVHIAIGVRHRTGKGLGTRVLHTVALALFAADPSCRRVLGDPGAGHTAARRAFSAAGFALLDEVDLPHKRAAIMAFDRPEADS
jgi:RimJ/RimL family protein N-acetyltransferase